jgi:thioredoxin 1
MLIDFWADWCGPCVALAPILEEVSAETGITIAKINVDENPDLASVFEIQGIPAVFIIVDGQPESKIIGINPKESYLKAIDSYR